MVSSFLLNRIVQLNILTLLLFYAGFTYGFLKNIANLTFIIKEKNDIYDYGFLHYKQRNVSILPKFIPNNFASEVCQSLGYDSKFSFKGSKGFLDIHLPCYFFKKNSKGKCCKL